MFEKVEFFVADVYSYWTPFETSGTFGAKIATHWYQCKVVAKKCVSKTEKTLKLSERDGSGQGKRVSDHVLLSDNVLFSDHALLSDRVTF